MPLSPEEIQIANELVAQNRVTEAIGICLVPKATFLRDYRSISANWSDLDHRENIGVMRPDDLQIERNKVIDRLLRLLNFESAPAWAEPRSLFTKSRLPYAVLSVCILALLIMIGWNLLTKPPTFPTVFAGYLLTEQSLTPIDKATVRLVDERGVEISQRTYQTDLKGYWIMRTDEIPTSTSKLIFTTPDCPGKHYEIYLGQLKESETSSDRLRVYTLSIDC